MAIYIFRNRMHHNIGSVIQRILDVWAQECVIHDNLDPMLMCHTSNLPNIHQTQCRIARTFYPYQFCLSGTYHLCDVKFDAWGKRYLDAMCGGDFGKVTMRATIHVGNRDDVGALSQGLEDCCGGSASGRERESVFGMFEGRYCFLKMIPTIACQV